MEHIGNMIRRIKRYLTNKIKVRDKTVRIGSNVVTLGTTFDGQNKVGNNSFVKDSKIGYGTYLGPNVELLYTKVGKFCSIARGVKTLVYTHPSNTFVSTSPTFFSTLKQNGTTYVNHNKFEECIKIDNDFSVKIGNDVWIGEDVTILGGITIGDGAILSCNALVTEDVLPYTIVGGVPAKKIKMRFSSSQIDFLNNFKWWNKNIEWIEGNADDFDDIESFMNKYYEKN